MRPCDCTCCFDKCKKLTTLQLLANAQALNTAPSFVLGLCQRCGSALTSRFGEFRLWCSRLRIWCCLYNSAGLSLLQWVKDSVLPQLQCRSQLQLDWIPCWGTSLCCGCGQKRRRKKILPLDGNPNEV